MGRMQRLLITGAAGNLGRAARAHFRGRQPHLRLSDVAAMAEAGEGEEVMRCDLADAAAVDRLCEGVDAIVHLGGQAIEAPWPVVMAANVHGAVNLWEAARRHGVERVIFASSNHAIGLHRRDQTLQPRSATRPDSRYGVSKVFGESVAELYASKFGVKGFVIRIGSCFPEPVDRRMLSSWLSYGDFLRLLEVGLSADYQFEVVYGVSANTRNTWWDISNAVALGYRPQDNAEVFAGKVGHIVAGNPASDLFMGGSYVADEFAGEVDRIP